MPVANTFTSYARLLNTRRPFALPSVATLFHCLFSFRPVRPASRRRSFVWFAMTPATYVVYA